MVDDPFHTRTRSGHDSTYAKCELNFSASRSTCSGGSSDDAPENQHSLSGKQHKCEDTFSYLLHEWHSSSRGLQRHPSQQGWKGGILCHSKETYFFSFSARRTWKAINVCDTPARLCIQGPEEAFQTQAPENTNFTLSTSAEPTDPSRTRTPRGKMSKNSSDISSSSCRMLRLHRVREDASWRA